MPDVPRFLSIGARQRGVNIRRRSARLAQTALPCTVVASAQALYFIPDQEGISLLHLDVLGKLFGAPELGDLGGEMDLTDLPAKVREHPDWPVTRDEGPVFVLPRSAVESVRTSFLLGGIEVLVGDYRILVFTPIFRRKQMAAYMAAIGWDVEGASAADSLVPKANARTNGATARAREMRKQTLARLIVGLVFILGSTGVVLWQLRWVKSALAGPVTIDRAELHALAGPDSLANPWVSFTYERSIDTGMHLVNTGLVPTILGDNRSRYILIEIQDCWLVAEVPEDHAGNQVTGSLEVWSTPLRRSELQEIAAQFPAERTLPFQLDAHYAYRRECIALLILVAVFFASGAYLIVRECAVLLGFLSGGR